LKISNRVDTIILSGLPVADHGGKERLGSGKTMNQES